tara:strand:- start:7592 stop:7843 length:252 start_codon:yes stop_codon:yes gene_type:complete
MVQVFNALMAFPPPDCFFENCARQGIEYATQHRLDRLSVLVYLSQPTVLIMAPKHFAQTQYVERAYTSPSSAAIVRVIVGEVD